MMPADYVALNEEVRAFDLDDVVRFVAGKSGKRPDWCALVVYVLEYQCFVELRDCPSDIRGNSHSEAEEVTDDYLIQCFPISPEELRTFRSAPAAWKFIDNR